MDYLNIDAFFPFYNEETNTRTCVLYKDGTRKYVRLNISKYIPKLFFEAGLNEKAVRQWTSNILKSKVNLPLLLTDKLIFIPVKFKPQLYIPGHAFTFGYINYEAIAFYSSQNVILKNETVLQTISPSQFIDKKVRDALLLSFAYQEQKKLL